MQLLLASGEVENLLKIWPSLPMYRINIPELQRLAMSVLGAGQVPRHIAFIMDGNRRFARCVNSVYYSTKHFAYTSTANVSSQGSWAGNNWGAQGRLPQIGRSIAVVPRAWRERGDLRHFDLRCQPQFLPQVTVYAFSIENFRRSEDEVNALLQLAKEKFEVDDTAWRL